MRSPTGSYHGPPAGGRRAADLDLTVSEPLEGRRRIPRERHLLRHRAGRGQWKDQRSRGVVLDVLGPVMVLLVNMAVENGDVLVRKQHIDDLRAVLRGPVPLGGETEERPVREHHDGRVVADLPQIGGQPVDLRVAHGTDWIRHVVERDEVHALVIERVVRGAEGLPVGGPRVPRGVVLSRHEVQRLHLQTGDDLLEFAQPLAAYGAVVGGVSQIAREHDEVGACRNPVHGFDGLLQGHVGLRIGHAAVAPMRVGELQEKEVGVPTGLLELAGGPGQTGREDDPPHTHQLEHVTAAGLKWHSEPPAPSTKAAPGSFRSISRAALVHSGFKREASSSRSGALTSETSA
jgi:hypothetical protein